MIQASDNQQQYVTDAQGNRVAVILGIERYEELLQAVEELDDIRAFDEAKASGDEVIPFEQAVREIEQGRS